MNSEEELSKLKEQTNAWVESLTPRDYVARLRHPRKRDVKVIRDGVTGHQILEPHEYLVLDHPLLQRLRYIHQTALSYLVYPTANHTRFDHSLGCAKIAKNMGDRLLAGEKTRIVELRLAALLHDVGHTFLSHLSEVIVESHFRDSYSALREARQFSGLNLKMTEMMAYLIVTSEPFAAFLESVVRRYYPKIDLDNVSNLLIHKPKNELAFMSDIISGPFDADKLDYLVRDCYFAGIRADVDVERVVISAARLDKKRFPSTDPRWARHFLVMLSGGVSILEQITFNKMLLFPAIYHHQKVRAVECMVKAIFEIVWDNPERITDKRLRFENILDFYGLTDPEFITLAKEQDALKPVVERLLKRELLERCLVLFPRYLDDSAGWKHLGKRYYEDSPAEIRWLRELVWQELPRRIQSKLKICDIWVDLPKPPSLGDTDRAFVDIGVPGKLLHLSDFFPYELWISTYRKNKLKGHVFSLPDLAVRRHVNKATQRVFERNFHLKFGERATTECKLPWPG